MAKVRALERNLKEKESFFSLLIKYAESHFENSLRWKNIALLKKIIKKKHLIGK